MMDKTRTLLRATPSNWSGCCQCGLKGDGLTDMYLDMAHDKRSLAAKAAAPHQFLVAPGAWYCEDCVLTKHPLHSSSIRWGEDELMGKCP